MLLTNNDVKVVDNEVHDNVDEVVDHMYARAVSYK